MFLWLAESFCFALQSGEPLVFMYWVHNDKDRISRKSYSARQKDVKPADPRWRRMWSAMAAQRTEGQAVGKSWTSEGLDYILIRLALCKIFTCAIQAFPL